MKEMPNTDTPDLPETPDSGTWTHEHGTPVSPFVRNQFRPRTTDSGTSSSHSPTHTKVKDDKGIRNVDNHSGKITQKLHGLSDSVMSVKMGNGRNEAIHRKQKRNESNVSLRSLPTSAVKSSFAYLTPSTTAWAISASRQSMKANKHNRSASQMRLLKTNIKANHRKRRNRLAVRKIGLANDKLPESQESLSGDIAEETPPIQIWRKWARVVKKMCSVCLAFRKTTGAFDFDASVQSPYSGGDDETEAKELYFNPKDYRTKYEFTWPERDKSCASKLPQDRTPEDIATIRKLMRGIQSFRKYTDEMQDLLCRVIRYCQYGKNRVIVRKGHLGHSFYFIFSGAVSVVFDKDSDSIFVRPEVSILRKGEVFGEIALLKNTRRNASIIVFDDVEMLAVDREDFYEYGLYDIMQKELQHRKNFLTKLDMFKTWSPSNVEDLCFLSRIEVHNYNRVILHDSRKSEWLYFVSEGSCDVIRLIDLTKCRDFDEFLPDDKRPSKDNNLPSVILDMETSLGYWRKNKLDATQASDPVQRDVDDEYKPTSLMRQLTLSEKPKTAEQLKTYYARNVQRHSIATIQSSEQLRLHYQKTLQDLMRPATTDAEDAPPDGLSTDDGDRNCPRSIMKKESDTKRQRSQSAIEYGINSKLAVSINVPTIMLSTPSPSLIASTRTRRRSTLVRSESTTEADVGDDGFIGIGLFVKVNHVLPGEVFGMRNVKAGDKASQSKKYSLVSKGAEVIRVPRSKFKELADVDTMNKVEKMVQKTNPTDDELCRHFIHQNEWNLFREDVVELVRRAMPRKPSLCPPCGDFRPILDYMRRRAENNDFAQNPSRPIRYEIPAIVTSGKDNHGNGKCRASSAPTKKDRSYRPLSSVVSTHSSRTSSFIQKTASGSSLSPAVSNTSVRHSRR